MAAATSARGPASERDSVVFFPGRDLLTVGLQELSDCQFQDEVSSTLIEVSALNDIRCEATRWRNGATNLERFIYLLKRLITEDPMPVPSWELKVETLLDTLVWATNRFGQLASVVAKIQEAASQMSEASGVLNPKMEAQQVSMVKMSEGLLALAARLKVSGDSVGPATNVLKQIAKSVENATWQLSGSGKVANMSIKEQLLSQGKLVGETSVLIGKILEAAQHTYKGIVAMNENQKECNGLLKELVAGQKLAIDRVATGGGQAASPAACPPVTPGPTIPAGGAGYATGVPAAFGGPGPADPVSYPRDDLAKAAACAERTRSCSSDPWHYRRGARPCCRSGLQKNATREWTIPYCPGELDS